MSFLCKQISADRWGIYTGTRLLATVSDRATCEAIMSNFESGRTKVPSSKHTNTHSQQPVANISAPSISTKSANLSTQNKQAVAPSSVEKSGLRKPAAAPENGSVEQPVAKPLSTMSDDDLAKILNVKSVKVKELESAVLRAQMSQRG